MGDDLAAEIEAALTSPLGPGVTVSGVQRLSSGASRDTWRFEASSAGRPPRSYVLQREMGAGGTRPAGAPDPLAMPAQARLLRAAHELGVPVPRGVAAGDMGGQEFIITEWVDGEALPARMLRDPALAAARAGLMDACAGAVAGIHRICPVDSLGLDWTDRVEVYRKWMDRLDEPRPVLELAYRWLVRNRPVPGPPVVVHGDFRLGNLLVDPTGLRAVLDWEFAHIGDRHEDLAWPTIRAWRFDRYRQPGIFPEPDAWLAAYSAAAGPEVTIDLDAFRWWQVAGVWIWAALSTIQARRHLDGLVPSVELATIGRRVCESEWDLLELLT